MSVLPPDAKKREAAWSGGFPTAAWQPGDVCLHQPLPGTTRAHVPAAWQPPGPGTATQPSLENGTLCPEPAAEHMSKARGVVGVPALRGGRRGCCQGLCPDVDSPSAISLPQTAVCPKPQALLKRSLCCPALYLNHAVTYHPAPRHLLYGSKFLKGIV